MSDVPADGDVARPAGEPQAARVRYPTNQVVAVVDTEPELTGALAALTGGGFLESEIHVSCGVARADALRASTGRRGLAGLATRIAERLGIENSEMEFKARYEQALRDDRFVVRVDAPTDDRKARATEILGAHGAHTVAFHGQYAIEGLVPPAS